MATTNIQSETMVKRTKLIIMQKTKDNYPVRNREPLQICADRERRYIDMCRECFDQHLRIIKMLEKEIKKNDQIDGVFFCCKQKKREWPVME